MKLLSKIVWSEGMYLGPHHFQAQNRYFEDSVHFLASSLWKDGYGFAACQIDSDALRNGTILLGHARGLFEDGLVFDIPESDVAPAPREIAALFSPVADHLSVHIAIPKAVRDGRNCTLDAQDASDTRYRGTVRIQHDENTGRDEKPITIGRKNIRFVVESEITDDLLTLPLVQVVRDGAGHFKAHPDFVPPCLRVSASEYLTNILRRTVEILGEKSATFGKERETGHLLEAGLSTRAVAQYWYLHAINTNMAQLRHFQLSKDVHPEELFRELSRLGGALCTFGLETHPRELPQYVHREPGPVFKMLDEHIRKHLEIVVPSKAIIIPLYKTEDFVYSGEIADERCVGPSRWILAVRSSMGEAELIAKVPQLTKVCSAKFVPELVKRALPGLMLTHLQVPPAAVAARVDSQYFVINRVGPCWEHIVQTRRVAAYIPGEIPSPHIELVVLLDD
jgi:type VI secretion system protein ImpJ